MNNAKKHLGKRILSVILSVLIVFSVAPLNVFVSFATEGETTTTAVEQPEENRVFTVLVTDGENPVSGAKVNLKNAENQIEETFTTAENGKAEFSSVAALESTFEGDFAAFELEYTVTKGGYKIANGTFKPAECGGWSGELKVALEKEVSVIPEEDYEIIVYNDTYDAEEHNAVEVTAKEGYTVQYSLGDSEEYTDEVPVVENAGEYKVNVKISKEDFEDKIISVTSVVSKADRTFAFETVSPENIVYNPEGVTFTNTASAPDSQEAEGVTYSVSDNEVAEIDEAGKLTFKKVGTLTVTATMAESENYNESTATYNITLDPAERNFGFASSVPTEITYEPELELDEFIITINEAADASKIVYSIAEQTRDDVAVDVNNPDDVVATIDADTGKLRIMSAGTIVIKATVEAAGNYAAAEATCTLTINRANQSFNFKSENPQNIAYGDEVIFALENGMSEGKITYSTGNADIITVDANGNFKAVGIGTTTISATKAGDNKYNEATAEYTVTVEKAEQKDFSFGEDKIAYYGTKTESFEPEGNEAEAEILYSLEFPEGVEAFANVDEKTGEITFEDKKTGSFTLKAYNPGNEFYNEVSATCIVTVEEKDFDILYSVMTKKGSNGWYTTDYIIYPAKGYEISYNNSFEKDNEWQKSIDILKEGINEPFAFFLKEKETGHIGKAINVEPVRIDKTAPTLKIDYSEAKNSLLEKLFYRDKVTVTLTSEEKISGVDKFLYSIDGGNTVVESKAEDISYDNGVYTYKFDIEAQYNGKVTANVIDKAGLKASKDALVEDENNIELVVDNIAPNVSITYNVEGGLVNGGYYNQGISAEIEVKEKNFYKEDIEITYKKRLNNDTEFKDISLDFDFKPVEGEADTYSAVIEFNDDADYIFDIKYIDKSGNEFDNFEKVKFTVDNTAPNISVELPVNGNYYNDKITAVFKVYEHNFDPSGVSLILSGNDYANNIVSLKNYEEMLQNADWKLEGGAYTAYLEIDEEARYGLEFSYEDKAGNSPVNSVKKSFVIDKTAPTELTIEYLDGKSFEDILNTLFYKDEITVKISASDAVSGIAGFTYSYALSENVSSKNKVQIDVPVTTYEIADDGSYTFKIPAQFRGCVSFSAIDMSGNESEPKNDTQVVIADNISPIIDVKVKYDNNSFENGKYYNEDRTAVIEVNEANFWQDDIKVSVNGEGKTLTFLPVTDEYNSAEEDTYSAEVLFDKDGEYKFNVDYTDRSGNVAEGYERNFVIDKTKPIISIEYNNNTYANGKYYNANRIATLWVNETNFNPADIDFEIDALVTDENGSVKNVVDSVYYVNYVKNPKNWGKDNGKYYLELPEFTEDGRYSIKMSYADLAGNECEDAIDEYFVIDKNPSTKLQIVYSEKENFIDNFLFFKDEVEVTISAFDGVSGVKAFDYAYALAEKVSSKNVGGSGNVEFEEGTYKASYTFKIPAQYRGYLNFEATDYAQWKASAHDEKVVVVDNVAPGVSVELQNNNFKNDKYYNAERFANVIINEANFWADDVELIVYRRLDTETEYKKLEETYSILPVEGKEDTYSAVIPFTENADYKFDIKYTDRSKNVYDNYDEIEFVVDKIAPVISLTYKEDSTPSNTNNYKTNRYPVITVTEHNFDPKDFTFDMEGVVTGADGKDVVVVTEDNGYLTYLRDKANWKSEGDKHTIELPVLNVNARYKIKTLSYEDLAGNASAVITDSFVIDKDAPVDLEIIYEDTKWYEGLFEAFTLGFYKGKTTVTLKAVDNVSGLDYFVYSYNVGQGADSTNIGKENVKVIPEADGTYTFDIPSQFRGQIIFNAVDKANNISVTKYDSKVVVVDDVAPQVNVQFDNNDSKNDNYYNSGRTASITVHEANFWPDDVVITVGKRGNAEEEYTETTKVYEFNPVEGKTSVYTTQIVFDEDADYTLDISYKDKSGNSAIYTSNVGEDKETFEKLRFTVDKIAPEMSVSFDNNNANNVNNYKANRTATVTVVEHNFDPKDMSCAIVGKNIADYGVDLTSKDYSRYIKNVENWKTEGDVHTIELDFDIDARYDVTFACVDLAGNVVENNIVENFVVDKVAPSNLTIEYVEKSVIDVILEGITFGFYKAPVKVILTATDVTSGSDYLTYSYGVSDDVSSVNKGKTNVVVSAEELERTLYTAETANGEIQYESIKTSFEMPAQFRGNVSFFVVDKAGNKSELKKDDKVVVIDNIAPVVTVEYDKYNDNKYYTERTGTITVKEANFWADDVNVIIKRRLDSEDKFNVINYIPQFVAVEGVEDTYKAVIKYNELNENAEYIFDIEYTDKSGNAAEFVVGKKDKVADYEPDSFTVDVTLPVINVSYDNNEARNDSKFKANRTATIVITEHNFRSKDVEAAVTALNAEGKTVETEDYASYLKNEKNWKSEGDVHTATVSYTAEADYTFSISYTDQSGNVNSDVNYGESVAPEKFTIDKTVPTASLTVGDWSASKNGTKWNKFLNSVSFSLWGNKAVDVKLNSKDELSGIETVEHFRSGEVLTLAQVKASELWIEEDTNNFSYTVEPDERFIVYVHVIDKSGNEIYLSSDGIIIDKTLPDIETIAPEITVAPQEQPVNGIYSKNVKVDLKVVDPVKATVYSGLKSVTYEIYNNSVSVSKPTQTGTLLTYDITATKQSDLIQKYEKNGCITVNAAKNNSNDVTIKITAVDNSDNITVSTCDLKIDITAPVIDISYNNNSVDSKSYFKADRTATIVVTERNFVSDDVIIDITNSEGKIPELSSWKKVKGTGNLDDTKWIAKIKYNSDGDYTFDIDYTDEAGLECEKINFAKGTAAGKKFTIDTVKPKVSVSYDNNAAVNGNYYVSDRVATIVIDEHNFNAGRVKLKVLATDDGRTISTPRITSWDNYGDIHSCKIYYSADAKYVFDVTVNDKAGNTFDKYDEEIFFVDKTDPQIDISSIVNNSANSGKVAPVIRFFDTNFDRNKVKVVLTGANRGAVSPIGGYGDIHNGVIFSFKNFAEEKSIDDIYTINVSITDMAGRTASKSVSFSVNRFGSVYTLGEALTKLIDKYATKTDDVVITETNPNKLENIKLTLFKNGETIVLNEGVDFKIDILGGAGNWYRYVYTVFKDNFVDDGVYSLSIHSEDTAGNVAENTLDTKDTEVNFGIDKTKPAINVKNVESNETYALDVMNVIMSVRDNLSLKSVVVELDGTKYAEWSGKELKELLDSAMDMSFDIPGTSTDAHTIKVIATDEAGNEQIEEIKDFYVTTNLWVRYYTNKPLFFGSIGGTVLLVGVIVFIATKKKKKEDK